MDIDTPQHQHDQQHHHHHTHSQEPYLDDDFPEIPSDPPPAYGSIITLSELESQSRREPTGLRIEEIGLPFFDKSFIAALVCVVVVILCFILYYFVTLAVL